MHELVLLCVRSNILTGCSCHFREIPEDQHNPGFVQHTLGYPLQSTVNDKTFGGSFLYHQAPNLVHSESYFSNPQFSYFSN